MRGAGNAAQGGGEGIAHTMMYTSNGEERAKEEAQEKEREEAQNPDERGCGGKDKRKGCEIEQIGRKMPLESSNRNAGLRCCRVNADT